MPRIPLDWLAEHVEVTGTPADVAAALVRVGIEEEAIHYSEIGGPLVVGRVLDMTPETHSNGKTINWCHVDVGQYNPAGENARGIVCGAHNFAPGDLVVTVLPGAVLPGGFAITARKTYGHISDGMICSLRELALGEEHDGIIVLRELGFDEAKLSVGQDAIALLGLDVATLEVNVTPDRGYCFSIRGIAREYAHATGAAFTDRAALPLESHSAQAFGVELADQAPIGQQPGCDRYVARMVRGVDASGPSPTWMQRRLSAAGMRPISLAVDVTNYVMLDVGQPLHAFDADALTAPIVVRRARPGETLVTLDDTKRTLDGEDLLITDNSGERILALAGVMGGQETEVTATTRNVLIEAAHFDPVTIARSARRHKLPSESARRFERGVDSELQAAAAQMAAELMVRFGGGEIVAASTDVRIESARRVIEMPISAPANLIGVAYSRDEVVAVLREIGCEVSRNNDDTLSVTPPSWRMDLTEPVDLIEEVARLRGYDLIPSVVPHAGVGRGLTLSQRRRRSVSRALAEAGLVEVLSYPFIGASTYDAMGLAEDDLRREMVKLANPMAADAPGLRTDMLSSVLAAARTNVGRNGHDVALYEMGLVFAGGTEQAPAVTGGVLPDDATLAQLHRSVGRQPLYVAGVMAGTAVLDGPWGGSRPWQVADALAAATLVTRTVGLEVDTCSVQRAPFHPGRCAVIAVADVELGYAGELHPAVCTAFDLPARAVAFELNLEAVFAAAGSEVRSAKPVSTFPLAKEDFAFVVEETIPAAAVLAAVIIGGGDLVEDARVFDVFRGEQVGEGKKSVAVTVRMRGADRTLSGDEIGAVREAIVTVATSLGATLR